MASARAATGEMVARRVGGAEAALEGGAKRWKRVAAASGREVMKAAVVPMVEAMAARKVRRARVVREAEDAKLVAELGVRPEAQEEEEETTVTADGGVAMKWRM